MPTQQTKISGFRAHFRNPKGFLGRIAGLLMVITNRRINRFVVEMLDVQARDHVLEIGFGPGRCIAMLAERATNGLVAGVDPSPTMIAQAGARNRTLYGVAAWSSRSVAFLRSPIPTRAST